MLRDERMKIPLKSTTTVVWTRQKETENQQNTPKSHVRKREATSGSREIGTVFDSWAAGESDSVCVRVSVCVRRRADNTTNNNKNKESERESKREWRREERERTRGCGEWEKIKEGSKGR